MDYKKILKIIGVLVVITGIIVGGYFLWQYISDKGGIAAVLKPAGTTPITEVINVGGGTGTTPEEGGLTAEEKAQLVQKLSILIDTPIFNYWINKADNSIYYVTIDGVITNVSATSKKVVSNQTLANLHSVTPSTDGSMALFELYYPQKPIFTVFSASTTNWQPLTDGTISADFSPNNKELVYLDNSGLKIMDLASFKIRDLQKMNQFFDLKWAKANTLLLFEKPSVQIPGSVYSLDIINKTIKKIISNESGLSINWSDNYEYGLKLNSVNKTSRLSLINTAGTGILDMSFITVPDKCLIQSTKIYCGIPKNIREGIVLPDNYYSREDYFIDDIFELDLPTNKITKLFDGNATILDAFNLSLKDGALLFINRYDNKLYSLKLD